jgi:hypothetical protein
MNRPLHKSVFHVWWDHVDGSTGKLVRSKKRKEDAASFIRKTPHLVSHGAAGCYLQSGSREVARDGKVTETTVRQDPWQVNP